VEDWRALAHNLNRVLTDAPLREKLRTNARLLAEQYSLEKSCANFEKALLEIVAERGREEQH
jgi:glycosyltransferase involved in cell wall biosynthesis